MAPKHSLTLQANEPGKVEAEASAILRAKREAKEEAAEMSELVVLRARREMAR